MAGSGSRCGPLPNNTTVEIMRVSLYFREIAVSVKHKRCPGRVLFDADYDTGGFDHGIGLDAFF